MRFLSQRTLKYGSNALTAIAIALGILGVINFLSARYYARYDLTERGLYTLSPKTLEVLQGLTNELTVVAFYRETEQGEFGRLLKQYAYYSKYFSYRLVDPDKEPVESKRYKITDYGTSVIEYGRNEERISEGTEMALTNALARATSQEKHNVYFLGGHDEFSLDDQTEKGFKKVKQLLIDGNYEVHPLLVLAQTPQVPKDCQLLIVAGPKTAFLSVEIEAVSQYLDDGGAALFLLDPLVETGLEPLLKKWSIGLRNDFVVDKSNVLPGADFSVPVAANYGTHPITAKHKGLMTFFPLVRSVEKVGSLPGSEVSPLVMSSHRSWSEVNLTALIQKRPEDVVYDSGQDLTGPLWLAMVVLGPASHSEEENLARHNPQARLVVFGDSDFATNQFVDVAGNGDLLMNAASWLVNERDRITIRPKMAQFRPLELNPGDAFWIRWVYWLTMPAIAVVAGLIVFWRRR